MLKRPRISGGTLGIRLGSGTLVVVLRSLVPSRVCYRYGEKQEATFEAPETMVLKLPIVAFALFLGLILPIACATDVFYCTKRAYEVQVQGVEISPDPVIRGQNATFSISAKTDHTITGGKLLIGVSYFGVHIHSETRNLCEETSCPVSADFVIAHTQVLPGFTPPGNYMLRMRMIDAENRELTCIHFSFAIKFGSSLAES